MNDQAPLPAGRPVAEALRQAAAVLQKTASAESAPRLEAELLLCHLLDKPRAWLFSHGDEPLAAEVAARFTALLERRGNGEPLAYLTGTRSFWTLELEVGPQVLIPRPETELLVELALERLPVTDKQSRSVLELGTGSGAIALSLQSERPALQVTATDISTPALAQARRNGDRLGLTQVRWLESDWYDTVDGRFDMIVSNPPYVSADDDHLQRGDCRFEPRGALTPGMDALSAYRTIVGGAQAHLAANGFLLLEHGFEQGPALRGLLARMGFVDIASHQDLQRHERVTLARLRP